MNRQMILIDESIGYLESMKRGNEKALERDVAAGGTGDHYQGVILGLSLAIAELNRLKELSEGDSQ